MSTTTIDTIRRLAAELLADPGQESARRAMLRALERVNSREPEPVIIMRNEGFAQSEDVARPVLRAQGYRPPPTIPRGDRWLMFVASAALGFWDAFNRGRPVGAPRRRDE